MPYWDPYYLTTFNLGSRSKVAIRKWLFSLYLISWQQDGNSFLPSFYILRRAGLLRLTLCRHIPGRGNVCAGVVIT